MEYLVRLAQVHDTFRTPELEALATLANVKLEFVHYQADVRGPHVRYHFSTEAYCSPLSASSVCMTKQQQRL